MSPTLLNQVEELTCRGGKYSTAAKVSQVHPFREHQEYRSICLKLGVAALPQCLNALDLLIVRLQIACFQQTTAPCVFLVCIPFVPVLQHLTAQWGVGP